MRHVFVAASVLLLPLVARAQVRLVDEGTFSIFADGERIGREDFSIRATGAAGNAYIAQGNVLVGSERRSVALNADSAGFPLRYTHETSVDGRVVEAVSGEARRGIWLGRSIHARGESVREFRLPPNSVAVETGVAHQLWFLLRRGIGPAPTILLPRDLGLLRVTLEDAGPDRVVIGPREFVTRRWVIRPVDGSQPVREAWTDLEGRVLRVRSASEGLEALRDEAPPETPGR